MEYFFKDTCDKIFIDFKKIACVVDKSCLFRPNRNLKDKLEKKDTYDNNFICEGCSRYNRVLPYDDNILKISYSNIGNSIIGNIFTGFNYGIKIEDSSNIEIIDNNIHHNRYGGISISDSSNFIIKYNNVTYSYDDEYNGEGIGLINSENISISFNKIMYNVCGFTIIKSSNNNISHNNIKGNSYRLRGKVKEKEMNELKEMN